MALERRVAESTPLQEAMLMIVITVKVVIEFADRLQSQLEQDPII
jgi:hypothetical protein